MRHCAGSCDGQVASPKTRWGIGAFLLARPKVGAAPRLARQPIFSVLEGQLAELALAKDDYRREQKNSARSLVRFDTAISQRGPPDPDSAGHPPQGPLFGLRRIEAESKAREQCLMHVACFLPRCAPLAEAKLRCLAQHCPKHHHCWGPNFSQKEQTGRRFLAHLKQDHLSQLPPQIPGQREQANCTMHFNSARRNVDRWITDRSPIKRHAAVLMVSPPGRRVTEVGRVVGPRAIPEVL